MGDWVTLLPAQSLVSKWLRGAAQGPGLPLGLCPTKS